MGWSCSPYAQLVSYSVFPCSPSSKYWLGSRLLNFDDQMKITTIQIILYLLLANNADQKYKNNPLARFELKSLYHLKVWWFTTVALLKWLQKIKLNQINLFFLYIQNKYIWCFVLYTLILLFRVISSWSIIKWIIAKCYYFWLEFLPS